jgi:hypothetical protein
LSVQLEITAATCYFCPTDEVEIRRLGLPRQEIPSSQFDVGGLSWQQIRRWRIAGLEPMLLAPAAVRRHKMVVEGVGGFEWKDNGLMEGGRRSSGPVGVPLTAGFLSLYLSSFGLAWLAAQMQRLELSAVT